jgi:hypothetical protein
MSSKEFAIEYSPTAEKEILPSPKFEGIYWQGLLNENELIGQEIELNGKRSTIKVIGFQGSDGMGQVALHPEPDIEESIFFVCGMGEMTVWNGRTEQRRVDETNVWNPELQGLITLEQASRAQYVLAVATNRESQTEGLILNIEVDDQTFPVTPVVTPRSYHHGTHLREESLYFVIKLEESGWDAHELVGFTGPYGGGQ